MPKNPSLQWYRVHTFGSHTHLITKDKKTVCGRDVSLYVTEVHEFPTKKCKRCEQLSWVVNLPEKLVTA